MMSMSLVLVSTIGIACYLLQRFLFGQNQKRAPLPPGPKGLPLLGNVADLPPPGTPEYTHWLKHKDLYGPISSVTVLGQTLVIINDKSIAFELLDKRSNFCSGRAKMKFAEMYVKLESRSSD